MVRHFDDYWKGHTMSDYAWSLMSPECQACQTHAVFNAGNYMYAGVGHVCCYYEKVLKIGFQGIIKEVLDGKYAEGAERYNGFVSEAPFPVYPKGWKSA